MIPFPKPNDYRSAVPGYRLAPIVAAALLIAGAAVAQPPATSEDSLVINSASSNIDDATHTADFKNVSVSQGTRRLTAERARATGLRLKSSPGAMAISCTNHEFGLAAVANLDHGRNGGLGWGNRRTPELLRRVIDDL